MNSFLFQFMLSISQLPPQALAQHLIEAVGSTSAWIKAQSREIASLNNEQNVKKLPAAYVLDELITTGLICNHAHVNGCYHSIDVDSFELVR